MEASKLKEILEKHKMWLNGEEGGERANLRGADLRWANLKGASLRGADLREADLRRANLICADLICADLSEADLRGTDICGVDGIPAICCPEKGSFIGFKKAGDYIVKILILDDAKRSSATSRKCRCSKAKVLSITELDGSETDVTEVNSNYDSSFVYRIGETVEVPDFDDDRWNECASGIHFFITRQEAVEY